MGKNKIKALIAVTTVATAVAATPTIVSNKQEKITVSNNKVLLRNKSSNKSSGLKNNKNFINKVTGNTNQEVTLTVKPVNLLKDLVVDVTNITVSKEQVNSPCDTDNYKPEVNVPKNGTIATEGTIVTYNISVSLRSKSGQLYDVPKLYLTASPIANYINKEADSPLEKKAAAKLVKAINVQLGQLKNLNSTSTFTISASFEVGEADWNVKVVPNINIHIIGDGKDRIIPIKVPNIKLTNHYINTVQLTPSLTVTNNKNTQILTIKPFTCSFSDSPGVYNPNNQTPKSITFKINNPNPNKIKITPLDIPGLIKNSNGTYTIKGENLLDNWTNDKLFKVTSITDNQIGVPITVTPISEKLSSGVSGLDTDAATSYSFNGGQIMFIQRNLGREFTMSQTSVTQNSTQPSQYQNDNQVTYGSTMGIGVPGKYKIYTGSLVSNGQIIVQNNNESFGTQLINQSQTYCHLNGKAVGILKGGTPEQKAQIIQDIISRNMSSIGVKYTGAQLQKIIKEDGKIPELNFVYGVGIYNGKSYSDSATYQTAPMNGSERVISRTITYGELQGTYTSEQQREIEQELKNGQLSSDGVITDVSTLKGFILCPPNKYTDSVVENEGINQITDERYGDYSHGLSSGVNTAIDYTSISIDNSGNNESNTTTSKTASWLDKSHSFNVEINGGGTGPELDFSNHSQIIINMGHDFKLTSSIQLMGLPLPSKNYKVDGDKLIINIPLNFGATMGSMPNVTYNAQYLSPNTIGGSLQISANVVGPDGYQGLQYNYNDNVHHSVVQGGIPKLTNYENKIVIVRTESNHCEHIAKPVNKSRETTLSDIIFNNNDITKHYIVVGKIPVAGTSNLPAEDGDDGAGNLGSTIESLNTNGAPTWILPKSDLTPENEEILDSPLANNLKGVMNKVEAPRSGWIKYVPGKTSLKGIVGYISTPAIIKNGSYTLSYNVKLINVKPGIYQTVNSAFKYFDSTDAIGSTSNIVTLTPPGENLSHTWISGVTTPTGSLSKAELDKDIDGNTLGELFGHGADNDGNWDLTPDTPKDNLQQKVDFVTNVKELSKFGYKLDSIEINGRRVAASWFENVGIINNTTLTHVKFIISPIKRVKVERTTTVKVVYSNGKVYGTPVTTTNVVGSKVNTLVPAIPKGYEVIKTTVNNNIVRDSTDVPRIQEKTDITIIYTIKKFPTYIDKVEVVDSNGNIVGKTQVAIGSTGEKTKLTEPKIPKGYHLEKITNVDNKIVAGVPGVFGNSDNTTIYHVVKESKTTIEVFNKTTDKIISVKTLTGIPGEELGKQSGVKIPKHYVVYDIKVNGHTVSTKDVPTTFKNNGTKIIYEIREIQLGDITQEVVTITGKIIEKKHDVAEGNVGDKTNLKEYRVPKGYHLVKILVDGKEITTSKNGKVIMIHKLPQEITPGTVQVRYIIQKDTTTSNGSKEKVSTEKGSVKVVVINTSGITISSKVYSGDVGTKIENDTPNIPSGDTIQSITVNGIPTSQGDLPKIFTNGKKEIIYTIKSTKGKMTYEVYINGALNTMKNLTGTVGTHGVYNVPHGSHFKLEKITVNGVALKHPTNSFRGTFESSGQDVIYRYKLVTSDIPSSNNKNHITPVKPNVDNNKGNHVIPVKPSTDNHKGDHVTPIKPNIDNHKSNHVTPVKPSTDNNKSDHITPVNQNTDNHKGDNVISVKPSTDNNLINGDSSNNNSSSTILPDTGLSISNTEKTTEEAGAMIGILGTIAGMFIFKRKK